MPRMLSADNNTLRIQDNISGSTIELHYRTPTTAEHTAYQNECLQRKGRKVITRYPQARIKYGLKILTGFRAGDFVVAGDNGQPRPIASDSDHADYSPQWREDLERYAGDIIQTLAGHVFDAPAEVEEVDRDDSAGDADQD